MILWKKEVSDKEKIRKSVAEGYKIPNLEKIQGFAGYFYFSFGDIYVSEEIFSILEKDKDFENVISECLEKFRAIDYGEATKDEKDLNLENRLFFGILSQLTGRYTTKYGTIKIYVSLLRTTEITFAPTEGI